MQDNFFKENDGALFSTNTKLVTALLTMGFKLREKCPLQKLVSREHPKGQVIWYLNFANDDGDSSVDFSNAFHKKDKSAKLEAVIEDLLATSDKFVQCKVLEIKKLLPLFGVECISHALENREALVALALNKSAVVKVRSGPNSYAFISENSSDEDKEAILDR